MWQKCPICDGEGRVTSNGSSSSVHQVCSVCNGAKIISELNGLPAQQSVPTVSKMERVQTAVEWLIEQLVELDKELDGRRKSDDSTVIKINPTKIYKQAKQIEKEQIIDAYNQDLYGGLSGDKKFDDGEQYYNETYNKNK